jgi:predicted metal-dependent peptidase
MAKGPKSPPKDNVKAVDEGLALLGKHSLVGGLLGMVTLDRANPNPPFPANGFVRLRVSGGLPGHVGYLGVRRRSQVFNFAVTPNWWRRATPAEWANVIGQAVLHVAMNHVDPKRSDVPWRIACDLQAADFLRNIAVGTRPDDVPYLDIHVPGRSVEAMASALANDPDLDAIAARSGLAGAYQPTWVIAEDAPHFDASTTKEHTDILASAIRQNIIAAVDTAGNTARGPGNAKRNPNAMAELARSWFIASYPLLASLAAAFEIVEDAAICDRFDIRIAAVDAEARRVYINPRFAWTPQKMRFVMAHELLHVGLSHHTRRQGRDPYLWNVACDYVINGWLVTMGVGELPTPDLLLDLELGFEKESAEAIYDRIVKDLRLIRRLGKCWTLRGVGKGDMLGERPGGWWTGPGCDLDAFYKRALADGIDLHQSSGRGLLPGDLVEEIRALQQPSIPWDVKLGQWLDAFFPPIERQRSYARASRRQSSTPDIPRPVYLSPQDRLSTRTFGVVVDTSGSMSRKDLAHAFGAIIAYAMSREVAFVRIIQCDAGIHDMGFVDVERLAQSIEVKGRGGTILRPAIAKLEDAADFPKEAPILIITDGMCDVFHVEREHAFLMPIGGRLPFRAAGPTFHFGRT